MRKITSILCLLMSVSAFAQKTIDISGDNTSSSYVDYTDQISIAANKSVDVKMARYCHFSSTIVGKGTLNLYAGGDRCYLGTDKGAAWPDWSRFKGNVNIHPFPANSSSAGFYGVVLAHGGKSFSPESIEEALASGKVNNSMEENKVILHNGATLCCEANTAGAGFRIGELTTEPGSSIIGYMKKNTRAAYFLLGHLNTNATLAGLIAPPEYSDTHPIGIIKEGTGTLDITGNENYLSGSLRVLEGRVNISNDAAEAASKKLRGAIGSKPNASDAIAFVFGKGVLGGKGSIGGTVDNYGTIAPGTEGEDGYGTLTLQNYTTTSKRAHLFVRPSSILRFRVASATKHDAINIDGEVKYNNIKEDFSESDKMPVVQIELANDADVKLGTEICLLTARKKSAAQAGEWNFELHQPGRYTWALEEHENDGQFSLILRLVSLEDAEHSGEEQGSDDPDYTPWAEFLYNDGIDEYKDNTPLRDLAQKNNKYIGTAISTWKNDITNESLGETREIGSQFNMLVAENEMKFDALEPSRGQFEFWAADNLVNYAQNNNMSIRGHCLAWHSQLPTWVSSDGKKNDQKWTRNEALDILRNHITKVVGHYRGKVKEWDVVNECLNDDQTTVRTNPQGYDLRTSVWTLAIGEDFIDSAFVFAHRADPNAELYLNDYGVELQGKAKSTAFHNLALRLKEKGIPIHGVGLQCHFSIGDVDSIKLEKTIKRFADAGLKCIITELDMGIPSNSASNLEEQARNYRLITDIVLSNENCSNLVIWGLKDNDSWRQASQPLLYDSGLNKKKAYYSVRSALRHRSIINEQTGIESVTTTSKEKPSRIYDLSGRAVVTTKLSPGFYIMDGKKIYIK